MKLEKIYEVAKGARAWANATERGCRQVEHKANRMTVDWIRNNCPKQKNSKYIIYTYKENLDRSKAHAEWCECWRAEEMVGMRETEKSFLIDSPYPWGKATRIAKEKVIGYAND